MAKQKRVQCELINTSITIGWGKGLLLATAHLIPGSALSNYTSFDGLNASEK
jgi:hypothetical protein